MTPPTAVAMSGGLDSSVAALLLARAGTPVIGLSMLLWDHSGEAKSGRCCGALDLADARRVAQQVGIPHYTLRMDAEFRRHVVDPFVDAYLAGRTPSPCVACNTWVKFDLLLARARRFGAARVATGHYARLAPGGSGWELHRAADPAKDQSYFLFELTQEQLAASLFPLGEMSKDETRALAREAGLAVAGKGESQDLCFVEGGIGEFVERELAGRRERGEDGPATEEPGPAAIVDRDGRTLGRGEPYYRYTVGQRRGLGVAAGERLYVLGVDRAANRVTVGREDDLARPGFTGERLHWIDPGRDAAPEVEVTVKIRSRHPGVDALVRPRPGGAAQVEFATPQRGVAPGQAAVLYRGSRVLGGCWIA